jgi:phage terminase large subunit-like protein
MKDAVKQWFQEQQPRGIFVEGICQLVRQWNACLSDHGTVFSGLHSFVQNNPE